MAVVCWNSNGGLETLEGFPTCGSLIQCCLVMLRFSFYDGTGFDFLQATIATNQVGLSLLLIAYLIFSAIILLNGLIGMFLL